MIHQRRHFYFHVPFCDGKCSYCAFYSERYTPPLADLYLRGLREEMRQRLGPDTGLTPETLYMGGGTPTLLASGELEQLCRIICAHIDTAHLVEWTVEANPGTVTEEKLSVLTTAGVNRISLGAQSFDDTVLRALGRRHTVDDIHLAVARIMSSGIRNFGLDLIASLPGLTQAAWSDGLRTAIDLDPAHISIYTMTPEEGTPFHAAVQAGALTMPDDDTQLDDLASASQILAEAGYGRYEISNFSRPGRECRHNLSFWHGGDYIGFGPAAASREGLVRRANRPDLRAYADALAGKNLPPCEEEILLPEKDSTERLVFGLRVSEGVNLRTFAGDRPDLEARWKDICRSLAKLGLLDRRGSQWALTARGMEVADAVAQEFI